MGINITRKGSVLEKRHDTRFRVPIPEPLDPK